MIEIGEERRQYLPILMTIALTGSQLHGIISSLKNVFTNPPPVFQCEGLDISSQPGNRDI